MRDNARGKALYQAEHRHRGSGGAHGSLSRASKKPTMGWVVELSLYATMAAFYASYTYDGELAALLATAKWVPMLVLAAVLAGSAAQHRALMPTGVLPLLSAALVLVATVSTLIGPYRDTGLAVLVSLVLTLATALLLASRIQHFSAAESFFQVIANVGRVVVVVSFVYAMLGLSLGRGERFSAWTNNPNSLALLLAPTLIILTARVLEGRRKWMYLDAPFLLMGVYVLLLTGSRAGIGWVAISLMVFWYARTGLGLLTGITFLTAILLVGSEGTFVDLAAQASALIGREDAPGQFLLSGRAEAWAIGLEKFQENFLGFGIGSTQTILEAQSWRFEVHQGLHFHSSFVSALVEVGVIGFLILLAILLMALAAGFQVTRRSRRSPEQSWASSSLPWVLLVGAVFHATMESWLLSAGNANMLLIWVVIALILTRQRQSLPSARSSPARPQA